MHAAILQGAFALDSPRHLADEHQQRYAVAERRGHAEERVDRPGAGGREDHAHLAGLDRVTAGSKRRFCFVSRDNDVNLGDVEQRVVER